MPRVFVVYVTKNSVTNEYYFGCHRTSNLLDSYLGSGVLLNASIKQYGRTVFSKVLLLITNSEKKALDLEIKLMRKAFGDILCLNKSMHRTSYAGVTRGGENSALLLASDGALREKASYNLSKARIALKTYSEKLQEEWLEKAHIAGTAKWTGSKHSIESKILMSANHAGALNSQYGTCWITDGVLNKKIPVSDLPLLDGSGWCRGRV